MSEPKVFNGHILLTIQHPIVTESSNPDLEIEQIRNQIETAIDKIVKDVKVGNRHIRARSKMFIGWDELKSFVSGH